MGDFGWVDMIVDEIGFAFTKVDETIQKSITLLKEFTEELFDDQPTQDSVEQHSSSLEKPVVDEVKETPAKHWSMSFSGIKEQPIQHWSMSLTKIPECLIQEQGDDHARGGDGLEDIVAKYFENISYLIRRYSPDLYRHHIEEHSGLSLKWDGGYEQLDDFEEEEEDDENKVSESCENMSELELESSATNYSPSCYHHHNEECTGSSLKCRSGYELLKDVDSWDSTVDEVEECTYSESAEEVMESLLKPTTRMFDVSNESLVVNDESDKFGEFVDLVFSEVKALTPESDWVYVTNDSY